MLEILQFIFSSFWVFCGTLMLLAVVANVAAEVTVAIVAMVFAPRTPRPKAKQPADAIDVEFEVKR